ncbi:MAG: HAMP domain-containing histidine kinase [Desulfobacterales bacterium]|nr:HAMP domain-containing histidine kinase [Desulfobacterales bacterium]
MNRIYFFIFLSLIVFSSSVSGNNYKKQPQAIKGILDLREWDFKKDGNVKLSGEWEFYWKKLLTSEDNLPQKSGFITVPGIWNGYVLEGNKLPADGYATYRLKILLNEKKDHLGFKFLNMATAFAFFINGNEITSEGIVGKNKETSIPKFFPHIVHYMPESNYLDVFLLISNFHNYKGGAWRIIEMGRNNYIQELWIKSVCFDMLLFGSIFIMGIYHIGLFSLRRSDKSIFYFGIFCLIICLRTLNQNEMCIAHIFPNISWALLHKIDHLTFYLSVPCFFMFINCVFVDQFSKTILRISQLSGVVFSFIVLLTSPSFFSLTLQPYHIITLLLALHIMHGLICAFIEKKEGINIFIIGFVILIFTVINDILEANQLITSKQLLVPFGIFIFILAQSYFLSKQFSNAFSRIEKLSQELKNLTKVKDEFLSNISHEVRTPFTSIAGFLLIIKKKLASIFDHLNIEDKKQKKDIEQIKTNIDIVVSETSNLNNIIEKLITFADIISGKASWTKDEFNMSELINELINKYINLFEEKGILIEKMIDDDIPMVTADKRKIAQVIDNLLSNALKFTNHGNVVCSIKKENGFIKITVKDTGIGLISEYHEKVFDKFTQIGDILTDKPKGLGLGLPLCKMIVEHHGGKIWVESEVGKGSSFIFTMLLS